MSRFWDSVSSDKGPLPHPAGDVAAGLDRMTRAGIVERIGRRDHTVWKADPAEISDRLGWLDLPALMERRIPEITDFADQVAGDGFTHAVLLGMGGSSLAPEVFRRTQGVAAGSLDLIVLDTTHPAAVEELEKRLDLDTTLFLVASKSGGTIETLSQLEYFWARRPSGAQFAVITDPGTALERVALDREFRTAFLNPSDVGGRYSALSFFGLVPAALIGVDLESLLGRAKEMAGACAKEPENNPGARLGVFLGEAALAGRDKLTLVFAREIAAFGGWVEQLIAESTGKEGRGIVPVDGEPLGDPKAYGDDRLFVASGVEGAAHIAKLEESGHPVLRLPGESFGADFFLWEYATAVAGYVLGINPFDQPNVAEAKEATAKILQGGGPPQEPFGDLHALLANIKEGDYVAIQAFLDPTPENERVLQDARVAIRDRYGVATTAGFGPRYLHSTGQLHKGGPPTGVFIQVVDPDREIDVPIPGKPYTFGTLIDAQAAGDLASLRALGRRVARVTPYHLEEVR